MTDEAPPARTVTVWGRALRLIWDTSPQLVSAVLVTTVLGALAPALNVLLIGATVEAVATAIGGGAGERLWWCIGGLVAVALYSHVLQMIQSYAENLLQARVSNEFNVRIMEKATTLELRDFEDSSVYDRLQLATREAGFRPYQLFSQLIGTLSAVVSLVSVSGILMQWSVLVALAMLVSPLAPMAVDMFYARKIWDLENSRAEPYRRGQYLQGLVTTDRAFKETRLLGLSAYFVARYKSLLDGFFQVDQGIERRRAAFSGLSGLVGVVATGWALTMAVTDTLDSGEIGRLAAYISGLSVVLGSTQALVGGMAQLFEHTLFLTNLFSFLDLSRVPPASGARTISTPLRDGVRFEKVTFRYPGTSHDSLTDVDLVISAGTTVALVGENGAGKTTIVKLLTRLYEPTSGRILLDGRDIREYDLDDLREHVSVLFQDFLQYEAPARENIGYGSIHRMTNDSALLRAADDAGARDIVCGLDDGLDTQLGKWFSGGTQLSGGQWQRVGLARALVRGAPILVLDEPTASLDPSAEAHVFERLSQAASSATTLLIAHRFSTVRTADSIVVLEKGRIIEQGNHARLMSARGAYARLFALQAAGYHDN